MNRTALTTILLSILAGLPVLGQGVANSDYRLGPGDVIEISVLGVDEYKYSLRIGNSGTISLPYLGNVEVSGKTAGELSQELEKAMNGRLFKDPIVSVIVQEYQSNPIILMGAVTKPGTYQMVTGEMKVLDLIIKGGGIKDNASDHLVIQRHKPDGSADGDLIKININDLMTEGIISSLNLPLRWGDLVHVPPMDPDDIVYIIGDVGRAGVFTLPSDRKVYLTQAVSAAGGALKTAKLDKGLIVRYDETGTRNEIAFNFKKILKGKQPDLFVEPRDIIFIPGSTAKTIGYAMVNMIPTTAMRIATGGIIY